MKIGKRLFLKLIKLFNCTGAQISCEERALMIIVNKLLASNGSEPLMAPTMNKVYVRSDDRSIFVVIDFDTNDASVINHHFGYDIKISERVARSISDRFVAEVEKRRTDMENEYRGNIQYSLSSVIKKL